MSRLISPPDDDDDDDDDEIKIKYFPISGLILNNWKIFLTKVQISSPNFFYFFAESDVPCQVQHNGKKK